MSESKPKPYTLKFRGRDANKNGHLDFLLKIVKTLGEFLVVEGQNHDEVISTFLEPLTDDDFETLEAHLKKCKRGDKKKEAKFVPKDNDGKPLKSVLSAYQLFCKDERPKIKAANPELITTEMSKALGRAWKKLETSKKSEDKERFKKYHNLNKKLKLEREKLTQSQKDEAIENGEIEERPPKRPMTSYFIFIHSDKLLKFSVKFSFLKISL